MNWNNVEPCRRLRSVAARHPFVVTAGLWLACTVLVGITVACSSTDPDEAAPQEQQQQQQDDDGEATDSPPAEEHEQPGDTVVPATPDENGDADQDTGEVVAPENGQAPPTDDNDNDSDNNTNDEESTTTQDNGDATTHQHTPDESDSDTGDDTTSSTTTTTDDEPSSGNDETAQPITDPADRNGETDQPTAILPPSAPDDLVELFEEIAAPRDAEALHEYLGERILALDDWVAGEPWPLIGDALEAQRQAKPEDPAVTILWAWYLVREKGPESPETVAVLAEVARIAEAQPENVWAILALVHRDIHTDDQRALQRLKAINEMRPEFALAWRVKAELHMMRNRRDEARDAALRSIELAEQGEEVFGELSVLGGMGHTDELRELYDAGALPRLSAVYAQMMLGQLALAEQGFDAAQAIFEAVLEELEAIEASDETRTHRAEQRIDRIRTRAHLELVPTAIHDDGRRIDWPHARHHLDSAIESLPDARDAFLYYVRLLQEFPSREIAASLFEPLMNAIELRADVGGTVDFLNIFGGLLQMVERNEWPREKMWRAAALTAERMRLASGEVTIPREALEVWIGMMQLNCPYDRHNATRLALPLEAGSLEIAAEEDLVRVVDWLVQLVEHDTLLVAMHSRMWLGVIVRESGVRADSVVGYAHEVLRRPPGGGESTKGAWATVLAVIGDEAHAEFIVDAMQSYIDAEDEAAAREVFRDFHLALRHLLDPNFRARFNPRRASLESLADLTEAWRNKLP